MGKNSFIVRDMFGDRCTVYASEELQKYSQIPLFFISFQTQKGEN